MEKVIIVGSGPAGFTAAIYTARARLAPLVIAGPTLGGQAALSSEVGNYPGFPEDISGAELAALMQKQAERFGARVEMDIVTEIDLSGHPFKVVTYGGEYETQALIVATGASPRKLGIAGEEKYAGRGVSYCATCDGFFFIDKEIIIVGGGDSAVQEAMYLTRFASKVTLIHRRNQLRAESFLQEQARSNPKIQFLWDSIVTEIVGGEAASGVRVRHLSTGEETFLPTDGVFVAIGYVPTTDFLGSQLRMDANGYVIADEHGRTSVEGVWAAGDVCDWIYRQIAASVGSGCRVAIQVEQYVAQLEHRAYPGEVMAAPPAEKSRGRKRQSRAKTAKAPALP
jgi:thioredoxin reductase (NADPH)